MEFCSGWYSPLDGQRSLWDGPAPSVREDLAQLNRVTDSPGVVVVPEDEPFVRRIPVLARL